jgi:hypothetical protein
VNQNDTVESGSEVSLFDDKLDILVYSKYTHRCTPNKTNDHMAWK